MLVVPLAVTRKMLRLERDASSSFKQPGKQQLKASPFLASLLLSTTLLSEFSA